MPASVQVATEPAVPKSMSSGWATTTRTRSTPSSVANVGDLHQLSLSSSSRLRTCGLPEPFDAFMTSPIRNPRFFFRNLSSPPRYSSIASALAASTASTSAPQLAFVVHLRQPPVVDDGTRPLAVAQPLGEHVLGQVARERAVADQRDELGERLGREREHRGRQARLVQVPEHLPATQLVTSLPGAPGGDGRLGVVGEARALEQRPGVGLAHAPRRRRTARAAPPAARRPRHAPRRASRRWARPARGRARGSSGSRREPSFDRMPCVTTARPRPSGASPARRGRPTPPARSAARSRTRPRARATAASSCS